MTGNKKQSTRSNRSGRNSPLPHARRKTSKPTGDNDRKNSARKPAKGANTSRTTAKPKLILFNKPFNTLCQFTGETGDSTLADFIKIPGVYAAGRLDKDSEGLLLLTNDGQLQHQISHPKYKKWKTYWVQVEGAIDSNAIKSLEKGVELKDGLTKPAKAFILDFEDTERKLWDRHPPVRFRANIPTSWISLSINEGKNRQVRRMTAAVGHPTLRLVRVSIDQWNIQDLQPGEYREIEL